MFQASWLNLRDAIGDSWRNNLLKRARPRRRATTWSRFPVAVEYYESRQVLSPVLLSLNTVEPPAALVSSVANVIATTSAAVSGSTPVAAPLNDQSPVQASFGVNVSVTLAVPVLSNSNAVGGGIGEGQGLKLGLDIQSVRLAEANNVQTSQTPQSSVLHTESLVLPVLFISFDRYDISVRTVFVKVDVTVDHVRFDSDDSRMAVSFGSSQPLTTFATDAARPVRTSAVNSFTSINSFASSSGSVFGSVTTEDLQERSRPPLRRPPELVEGQVVPIPRPAFEQLANSPLPTHPLIDPSFFGMVPTAPLDLPRQTNATVLPAPLDLEALSMLANGSTRTTVVSPQVVTTETTILGTSEKSSPMPEAALALEEATVIPEVSLLPPIPADRVAEPGPWAWMRDPKVWVAGALALGTAVSCWAIERKRRVVSVISELRRQP